MIAILKTLCGCERAINVSFPAPHDIKVPIHSRAYHAYEKSPTEPTYNIRVFEFYEKRSDGISEYRERIE